tara:strand:+ start:380 stop:628 length:249 start_codon:yes stop_codon:yes gene_type:complete
MYSITLSDRAKKQLKKLESKLQDRIVRSLERIKIKPMSYVEKLVGDSGYKFRVGDHRILMDINNNKLTILVIKMGHRKNIYD